VCVFAYAQDGRTRNYGHFHPDIVFSTAADIARDVAGLHTVEGGGELTNTHIHTHTHTRTRVPRHRRRRSQPAVGRRRNVQSLIILCCFFFPFHFAFYIVIACALCTPIFVFYNTRRRRHV